MHDKDFDIYEAVEILQRQLASQHKEFLTTIEILEQEITLLRNEINLVKLEGCWISAQHSKNNHKDPNE